MAISAAASRSMEMPRAEAELFQREADIAGVWSLSDDNIQGVVLHGGIKNFLHGVIEPMNFVDKEYIAFV